MAKTVVFIDAEIGVDDNKIHDLGAVKDDRTSFHSASIRDFISFISGADFMKEFGAVPLGQYDPMRMIIWEDAANEIISQYEEVDQNG